MCRYCGRYGLYVYSCVDLHQQSSPSAVWRLAHRRKCVNATRRRHVCIQYTVNFLLCRSNRMLAVHVHTSMYMHTPHFLSAC